MSLTVKELIKFLKQFPNDMEIMENRYSDAQEMDLQNWTTIHCIERVRRINREGKKDSWLEVIDESHISQLSDENKQFLKKCVFFCGN